MGSSYEDRTQETTPTTGTGSVALLGAVTGFQAFATGYAVGDLVRYCIQGGAEWEVGEGVLTGSSTLSRVNVFESSNANALVSFSAGTKNVFSTLPADAIADIGLTIAIRCGFVPQ